MNSFPKCIANLNKGLVWSAESNKLLGFTDIEYEGNGDKIATNILQGFF
jgi:hypothetical protein